MNVLLHSRHIINDSPYFFYLLNWAPKGTTYVYHEKDSDVILDSKLRQSKKIFSGAIRSFLSYMNTSYINVSEIPDIKQSYNLIHSLNTVPNTTKPFVLEIEAFHSLIIGNIEYKPTLELLQLTLEKNNCKKIIFWTENGYNNFFKLIPSKIIKSKSIILPPGVPLCPQNKPHKIKTIGFIARDFYSKGGKAILNPMKEMVIAQKAKAIIITDLEALNKLDPAVINDYSKYIEFKQLMPREKLHADIFPKIDILFYPGYSDTFGFIFPEAMSHGIPILTVNGCARKEMVNHGNGGYVVDTKLNKWGFVEKVPENDMDMIMCLTHMINDNHKWKEMSNFNWNEVDNGKFSLFNRNIQLEKIYKKATV